MNTEIAKLVAEKKRLFFACRASSSQTRKAAAAAYNKHCKLLKKKIKQAVTTLEHSLADDKANPKRLFSYINSKTSARAPISRLRRRDGTLATDGVDIANALNAQFESVFTQEDPSTTPVLPRAVNADQCVSALSVTPFEVEQRLRCLETSKASGDDNVAAIVLKSTSKPMSTPLAMLFNKSLASGTFPRDWKRANVTPIYKKGSRLDPSNYRPVSLISIAGKVLEWFVRRRLMSHFDRHQLLSKSQHGFLPRKSCTTNLLETLDFLSYKQAHKRWVDVIFLDFAKAFDSVPHHRLIAKLQSYGIEGSLLEWIDSFLRGRTQRVLLGEHASRTAEVKSGVPQGSVLGPTLFIIFVNDLLVTLESICKAYADDMKLLADVSDLTGHLALQRDLDTIVKWTSDWLVKLHPQKCKVMHIGKCNPKHKYFLSIDGVRHQLEPTRLERDLGVHLTDNLKWQQQCAKASQKALLMLGILKRSFVSRKVSIWRQLYSTYVRPLVEFAVPVWSPYTKADINTIEKVQRKATKIPTALANMDYDLRCKAMGLPHLQDRRRRGDLKTYIFKGMCKKSAHVQKTPCAFAHNALL